jgi:RNA polymerase sigma-70 factor (ECF subfamily)
LRETFGADLGSQIEARVTLDRERLAGCLEALAERDRSVLYLSFYAERTPAELARDLGTSQDNARLVRHRALARLAACVSGERSAP